MEPEVVIDVLKMIAKALIMSITIMNNWILWIIMLKTIKINISFILKNIHSITIYSIMPIL